MNESTETRDSSLDDIAASTEEMLTVYGLARSLTARVTLSDAGDIIAKHLKRLLPASTCAYFMYDSASDMLVARHVSGVHSQHFSGLEIGMGERLSGWVAANRHTIVNSDPLLDLGEVIRSITPRPRSALSTRAGFFSESISQTTSCPRKGGLRVQDHVGYCDLLERRQFAATL